MKNPIFVNGAFDHQGAYNKKSALITGVSGFLGRALCHQLIREGYAVTGIDKTPPIPATQLALPQNFIQLDLLHPHQIAFQAFDLIYHLAGAASVPQSIETPEQDFVRNLTITFRLLDALRACAWQGRFVYVSTAAVYGEAQQIPITEEAPTRPISPYGASKLACENYVRVFSQCYGFRAVIARIFSLYGPRQERQVIFDILRKMLLSETTIELFGYGCEVRDFIHVADAVNALSLLSKHATVDAPIFNICSANGITIRELAEKLASIANQNPERIIFTGYSKNGDPACWIGCNKKIRHIGFDLQYSLSSGLIDTLNWFRRHYIPVHALTK